MKKFLLFSMMLFILAFMSCKKNNVIPTTTGKMLYPQVTLVQGSELVTKSLDQIPGNQITKLQYEFWVTGGNAGSTSTTWVLAKNGLFKDGTDPQSHNSPIWTVDYPNTCTTCFIEVPLNMRTRVVVKGLDSDGKIKYYGIYDSGVLGWTDVNIPTITINLYEIDSRLKMNVDDLIKNTNYDFHFTFSGNIADVDYDKIVQMPSYWLINNAKNNRSFNSVPLKNTNLTSFTKNVDVIGSGAANGGGTPTYKIDGVVVTDLSNVFELFAKGASSFTVTYSIVRKDGYVASATKAITAITVTSPTIPTTFIPMNWLQAGYNFNITFTVADPTNLGQGCFIGTLTFNDNIDGTVNL
jgi:hypothetical protein